MVIFTTFWKNDKGNAAYILTILMSLHMHWYTWHKDKSKARCAALHTCLLLNADYAIPL